MTILSDYQRRAARFALDHPECGLFLDMGLGKTLTTIAIMDTLRRRGQGLSWLVVAPARVARHSWPDELAKWSHLHHLTWTDLTTPAATRERLIEQPVADVTIISRELLGWLDDHMTHWPWNGLIIDELSGFRNPRATRFRILKRHRKTMRRVIGLTGTPVPKSLDNLWAQIWLLDQGRALGRTISAYRQRWFTPDQRNWATGQVYSYKPLPGAFDAIMDAISPFCLTMSRHDELPDIPDARIHWRIIPMPDTTRIVYDRLHADMAVDLDPGTVTAASAGVLTGKLDQTANGFLYPDRDLLTASCRTGDRFDDPMPDTVWNGPDGPDSPLPVETLIADGPDVRLTLSDGTRVRPADRLIHTAETGDGWSAHPTATLTRLLTRRLDTAKLDAVHAIAAESDEPLLIFHRYREELDRLRDMFGPDLHTLDEPDMIGRWNRGEIRLLACQPAGTQYGLNLQYGGHRIIWTAPTWNLEEFTQANARLTRRGQTHPVDVTVLVSDCPVERRMVDVLAGRARLADAVADALRHA